MANIITCIRIICLLPLIILPAFSKWFYLFYLVCGITDVLDGFVARKLHIESETGAMLDSMADLLMAFVYTMKILPLMSIPLWIWIWTIIIAIVKSLGIFLKSREMHRLFIEHSFANKITGLLIFLLPLSLCIVNVEYSATLVCTVATFSTIEEIFKIKRNRAKK